MDEVLTALQRLLSEAGRTISAANEAKIKAAIASLNDVLAALGGTDAAATESAIAAARGALDEALLSHDQKRQAVRGALQADHGPQTYPIVQDMYDDSCVYSLDGQPDMLQRSYSIDPASGAVDLGDPISVRAMTQYVPIGESAEPLDEADYSFGRRMQLAKQGHALADGSFPIANVADLENAVKAYGRASDKEAAKAHIIMRAKALKATDKLPADWQGSTKQESAAGLEIQSDLIPLVERSVRQDGTVPIKLIGPGWGSSGYYPAAMLKRDGPKVFKSGLHMYTDHPTSTEDAERPERSIKDLAGTFTTDAAWQDDGPDGPGLYAEARVRSDLAPLIEELAPSIGVSIRAHGRGKDGAAEGRTGKIIESIDVARSVDFVTLPGRGGKVLELAESARAGGRNGGTDVPAVEVDMADDQELKTLREALDGQVRANEAMANEVRALNERLLLRDARDLVSATLAEIDMPDVTRARLLDQWAQKPVLAEGALDRDATTERVREAARAEIAYLSTATGGGRVRGMGTPATVAGSAEDAKAKLAESLGRLGLAGNAALVGANGRA